MLDFGRFEVLTFDCFGTLIDWDTGITGALRTLIGEPAVALSDEDLLERYAAHEADLEAGPYLRYRDVLARSAGGICTDLGVSRTDAAVATFAASIGDWPAFPDSAAALARLQERFKLGVITNCDDDLFAAASPKLGVTFDWVITAQQVGSYKPSHRNFEVAFRRIGVAPERILHVAQSRFHDHVPARELGFASVWVNRRRERPGSGGAPASEATPSLTVPDMATLAELALP